MTVMLAGTSKRRSNAVEARQAITTGIAASAIAHLSILMLVLFLAEVHPFGSVTAEAIAVDIVSPEEVVEAPKQPDTPPTPEVPPKSEIQIPNITDLPTEAKSASAAESAASASPPPAAAPQATARPQKQAAPQPSRSDRQQAAAQPQPQPQPQPQTQQPTSLIPAAIPQAPDVSVKYHVLLGLPPAEPSNGFDAPASAKAEIASNLAEEFRRHLRTCSKLPASIAPSDKVRIVLRVFMTLNGKLSAEPALIEASASTKGPALMQSAIDALRACQPYAMLPSDRYGEWKVLDLSFTPRDFAGG